MVDRDTLSPMIWRLCIPLKVKALIWLVLKERIYTLDNILNKEWMLESANETIDYLFMRCVFSLFLLLTRLDKKLDFKIDDDVRGL